MAHVNPIQIQKFLKGVNYPATKAALLETAKDQGADENVYASLEQLPDQDFETPADVSQAFGQMPDQEDANAQGASSSGPSDAGAQEFIAQTVADSLAEVELCELALQKTENDEVKIFAQRMIDEHSKMGMEAEQLASKNQFDLPRDLDSEHKSVMKELEKLSGQDFDRRFMEFNVKEHEKDVKVFKHYAGQEGEPSVRAMAKKGARMLEQHLKMAQDIQKRLGV